MLVVGAGVIYFTQAPSDSIPSDLSTGDESSDVVEFASVSDLAGTY